MVLGLQVRRALDAVRCMRDEFFSEAAPSSGSSPAPNVCGGAQRGISLAIWILTGEATRKPPACRSCKKRLIIKGLWNHDLGALDSFGETRESTSGEATLARIHPAESTLFDP